jgi:ubiquinone/menaquinone biosynthesis C-methylase UbiE
VSETSPKAPALLFDALAEEYEDVRLEVQWDPFPHLDALLAQCGSPRGRKVLDVGCATGELAERLVAMGAQLVGVDVSVEMCAQAAERVPNTPFFPIDIEEGLPFDSHHFDLAIGLSFLEWVEHLEEALDELARVLRPGGWLLLSCETCAEGEPLSVDFLDGWRRYRITAEALERWAQAHLDSYSIVPIPGFLLDSGERSRYLRLIGRKGEL